MQGTTCCGTCTCASEAEEAKTIDVGRMDGTVRWLRRFLAIPDSFACTRGMHLHDMKRSGIQRVCGSLWIYRAGSQAYNRNTDSVPSKGVTIHGVLSCFNFFRTQNSGATLVPGSLHVLFGCSTTSMRWEPLLWKLVDEEPIRQGIAFSLGGARSRR